MLNAWQPQKDFRVSSETKDAVLTQLKKATYAAGESSVKEARTATGVKDTLSDALVQRLIQMGKDARKKIPGRPTLSSDAIHQLLMAEMERHKGGELFNPLLVFQGPIPR